MLSIKILRSRSIHQLQKIQLEKYLLKEGLGLSSKDSVPRGDFYELEKREHINFML